MDTVERGTRGGVDRGGTDGPPGEHRRHLHTQSLAVTDQLHPQCLQQLPGRETAQVIQCVADNGRIHPATHGHVHGGPIRSGGSCHVIHRYLRAGARPEPFVLTLPSAAVCGLREGEGPSGPGTGGLPPLNRGAAGTHPQHMAITAVRIDKPEGMNVIIGQTHFIKTVEDLHEALAGTSPHLRFGLAFCEASGPRLIRHSGNDQDLTELAVKNAQAIGAGHAFVIFLREGYPVNVLGAIKQVPEVCTIFCATANPVELLIASTELGRGIVGVIDGGRPRGVETAKDQAERRALLRDLGYKL